MKYTIIIKKTGELKKVKLKSIDSVDDIQFENKNVSAVFNSNIRKSKNFKNNFKRYCDWELDDFIISIFGSKNGKAGSENKYDLPPPEDNDIYFGEILIVKSKDNIIQDLNIKQFKSFIKSSFGGFEDLGSQDTEEEYNPELDKYETDFVVDDDVISYDEDYNPDDEEEEEEYNPDNNEDTDDTNDTDDTDETLR